MPTIRAAPRNSALSKPARSESSNTQPIAPAIGGTRNGIKGNASVITPMRASVRSLIHAMMEPAISARTALAPTTTTVLKTTIPTPGCWNTARSGLVSK